MLWKFLKILGFGGDKQFPFLPPIGLSGAWEEMACFRAERGASSLRGLHEFFFCKFLRAL